MQWFSTSCVTAVPTVGSLSSAPIAPSNIIRSGISARRSGGTTGSANRRRRSNRSYRRSIAISSTSRKPWLTSMPVAAPLRSITALVTRVVPWAIVLRSPIFALVRSNRVARPLRTHSDGSAGVVSCLCTARAPVWSSTSAKSVKVPPMSIPSR